MEQEKYFKKYTLQTFARDRKNIFDPAIDTLIEKIKKKIHEEYVEHEKLITMETDEPYRFQQLDYIAQQSGHSLNLQMYEHIESASYLEDELYTLFETKIIYAFKHLEINLKDLISEVYEESKVNKHSKWENLIEYLKVRRIDLTIIEGYHDINQLREVNNALKHSSNLGQDIIRKITEFNDIEIITYRELENFYTRVKNKPKIFITALTKAIDYDLYSFDLCKLQEMAKSLASRLEADDAQILVEELMKLYANNTF